MTKTINELSDTFIYLCDQHGVNIQITSITETSFVFKQNICGIASNGLSDVELAAKCNELASSVGLQCVDGKCIVAPIKVVAKKES